MSRFVQFLALSLALRAGALEIGFIDPASPGATPRRNAAALAYARTLGPITRLRPNAGGGWTDADGRLRAPEEFDVVWYHEGDDPGAARLTPAAVADLADYLEGGGAVLLSGCAGVLVHALGIEPTAPRVLSPTSVAYPSGLLVRAEHRDHPAFAGLDTSRPILLTSLGGNALADFYDTAGPHGVLLAEGNAGLGERPLVEYPYGAGRAIFVGWRLADFTTAGDPYRPNLERLFANLLGYLSQANSNRAALATPPGPARYARLHGQPFLIGEHPAELTAHLSGARTLLVLTATDPGGAEPADGGFLVEQPTDRETVHANALALTVHGADRPIASYLARRRAEQAEADARDAALIGGLQVVRPQVRLLGAPLQPLRRPRVDRSVLVGHSPFMAPGGGLGAITPMYEPVEDGGFRITGSRRRLNRPIVQGQNRVWTGDAPIFRMDTVTGNGTYAPERVFPLWPRPDAAEGNVNPQLGTLRLGVAGERMVEWFDELTDVETTFRPGYTQYRLTSPAGWSAELTIAPALDFHGLVCRVLFDRELRLVWRFADVCWSGVGEGNAVAIDGQRCRLTDPSLPNGESWAGWDGDGEGRPVPAQSGEGAEFVARRGQRSYHVVATWGVTGYDEARAKVCLDRLDTPAAAGWPAWRERLQRAWFDAYIGRALRPEANLATLLAAPEEEVHRTVDAWDRRRAEFQIRTPDPYLNALVNWARCTSEYHRQGPGLVLGAQIWQMYSHISTGWYGKQWAGDHEAIEECLRLYAAMQDDSGFIRWIAPSMVAFFAENNTPYFVDQVWRHYTWTGDRAFVVDLWPHVERAVAWSAAHGDPDGDGLYRDSYEYWNCDSNGKGPKSAAATAMAWAAVDRAARLAEVVGDRAAAGRYRERADYIRERVMAELWNEDEGRLGCIGADGLWRGHPQIWEEYLAILAGLLDPDQGRRAMRWLAGHYGFEPQPGVRLLACSDWFPIRWSVQWVPTGDTCLAALAGMRCGDADLWWPFLRTVVGSAFQSDFPGINMGISNAGAGGGDREDVDSVDPHLYVAVRGLFGVEPDVPNGQLQIAPAFPSDWTEAAIRTPDVAYEYRRNGPTATLTIQTPRPMVKRVRATPDGPEVVTPAETDSVVSVALGPPPAPVAPPAEPPILADQQPASEPQPLAPDATTRLVLFDLSAAANVTAEELSSLAFVFDYADRPQPLAGWWGNPPLAMPPTPRAIETPNGVRFLITGRPRVASKAVPKNLLALSSWPPYPLPGGAVIPIGRRCERLWLLLQSYVHPMKNYLPNGEVVLRYADGTETIVSLVPPFNLDAYFQHFSLEGEKVPLGQLPPPAGGFSFVPPALCEAHADALPIACDATKTLHELELRATCSEGVIGLAGLTVLAAAP